MMINRFLSLPRWLLLSMFYGCATAVLVLSLLPQASQPVLGSDKVNHIVAFGVLWVLGSRCWPRRPLLLAVFLTLFGVGIEIAQSFTPDRTADVEDVLADVAGLLLAYLTTSLGRRLSRA